MIYVYFFCLKRWDFINEIRLIVIIRGKFEILKCILLVERRIQNVFYKIGHLQELKQKITYQTLTVKTKILTAKSSIPFYSMRDFPLSHYPQARIVAPPSNVDVLSATPYGTYNFIFEGLNWKSYHIVGAESWVYFTRNWRLTR